MTFDDYLNKKKKQSNEIAPIKFNSSTIESYSINNTIGNSSFDRYLKNIEEKKNKSKQNIAPTKVENNKKENLTKNDIAPIKKTNSDMNMKVPSKTTQNNVQSNSISFTNNQKFVSKQDFDEQYQAQQKVKQEAWAEKHKDDKNMNFWDKIKKSANYIANLDDLVSDVKESGANVSARSLGTIEKVANAQSDAKGILENTARGLGTGLIDFANFSKETNNYLDKKVLKSVVKNSSDLSDIQKEKLDNYLTNNDMDNVYQQISKKSDDKVFNYVTDKKLDTFKKLDNMKENNTNIIQKNIDNASNPVSKKISELTPSIGQMIPTAIPYVGQVYAIGSAGGNYYDEAKKQRGMNEEQAYEYGAIMGGVEGITEKIQLGKITKAGKNIAKGSIKQGLKQYGLSVADNFIQEAITEPISEVTATVVAGDDKADWSNMGERMLKSGIDGALTAIIMDGASAGIGSAVNIKNKINNNQTVTETELKNTIIDIQNSGKVDAEGILKDEIQYQSKKYTTEIQNNNNLQNDNINGDIAPINSTTNKSSAQMDKFKGNINDIAPIETDYNISAKKYNIDTKNETVKTIYNVTNNRGIKAKYDSNIFDNNTNINALWRSTTDENGNTTREIIINPNADTNKTLQNVLVHELTHDFEGTQEYNEIKDLILNYDKNNSNYENARKSLEETYQKVYDKNSEEFNDLVDNEAVADILGNKLGDQDFINSLVNQKQSVGKRIYNWVVDKLNKINKLTGYKNERLYWSDVKNKFEKAYKQAYTDNGLSSERMSIVTNEKGQKYVQADRKVIDGNNPLEWEKQVKNYIDENIRNGKDVNVIAEDGTILSITENTSGKAMFRNDIKDSNGNHRKLNNKEFASKLRAETHIDELAEVSKFKNGPVKDTKSHDFAKDGFTYRNAYFMDNDGAYYKITMSVGKNGDINTIYNVGKMERIQKNRSNSNSELKGSSDKITSNRIASENSITSERNDVNYSDKYSMQDTENNSQWQEYLEENYKSSESGQNIQEVKNVENKSEESTLNQYSLQNDTTSYDKNNIEKQSINKKNSNKTIYEKAKSYAEKVVGNKTEYTKNKSDELYSEIRTLSKGVKASEDLVEILDTGFEWQDIKTALVNIKYSPDKIVHENSNVESVIRKILEDKFEKKYDETYNNRRDELSRKTRTQVREELLKKMGITESDIEIGNDISALNYQVTDPTRVNEKVFGKEIGKKINEVTIEKTRHNTAEKTRWLNKEREEIKSLRIKARSKESAAVQKYGEKQYVDEQGNIHNYGDAELSIEFPNIKTQEKIKKAATKIKSKYETYIDEINEVLTDLGYDAIPKRNDYMRHFQELGDIFSKTGVPFNLNDLKINDLPTDINGLTEFNRPGKNYFASANKREGIKTTYDAITGIDGYLESAGNLIFHTEDIQNYRALSKMIRDTFGQTKGFDNENFQNMTDEQIQKRIKDIQNNKLSKYVAWLDEQANALAGKKGAIDRATERFVGRRIYSIAETAKKQVGSNMTGFNVGSALTNFAADVQAMSRTNPISFVKGTISTISNIFHNDGFIDKSDFLTSRFGSNSLSQKLWQKASNAGQILMSGTDWFTSNQIVRSKYYEGISKGMKEADAIKYADNFAARVMGDRSQGATAEIFNSKTLGLLTQFQLETVNYWQNLVHDTKMDAKGGARYAATALFNVGVLFGLSNMFNNLTESIMGRSVMFDPIEIIKTLFGLDDDDNEEKSMQERIIEANKQIMDNIPFVSILTGGGRIPTTEAFSGLGSIFKKMTGQKDEYGNEIEWKDVGEEFKESIPYWIMPTGYGQLKKTQKGLSMYNEELPIAGSYTDSGNLRFKADTSTWGKIKSSIFGQYSSKEAQEYIDSGFTSIKSDNIQELKDLGMSTSEFRAYQKGLSEARATTDDNGYQKYLDTKGNIYWYDKDSKKLYDSNYNETKKSIFTLDKADSKKQIYEYINSLDVSNSQKNIMLNNAINEKSTTDKYGYQKYTEKNANIFDSNGFQKCKNSSGTTYWYDATTNTLYNNSYKKVTNVDKSKLTAVTTDNTYWYDEKNKKLYDKNYNVVSNSKLKSLTKETAQKQDINEYNKYSTYAEFDYAYNNPEKYKNITKICDYKDYSKYEEKIKSIKNTYNNSTEKKNAVFNYIESLPLESGQKLFLYKDIGGYSIKNYKKEMYNYIESMSLSSNEKTELWNYLYES